MTKMLIWLGFIETGPKRLGMAKIIAVEPHHMTASSSFTRTGTVSTTDQCSSVEHDL